MKYITHSVRETKEIGKKITLDNKGGTVICLHGDLGAGKTTMVQGIAEGLGISSNITSPTFTLMNIYQTDKSQPKHLIHIDTYRLKDERELVEIGVEDYLGDPETLSVVEWPEKIAGLLKNKKVVNVTLNHLSKNEREIIVD